jgi:hypothetical protein
MKIYNNTNLESRALAAYFRFGGHGLAQPAAHRTRVRELAGLEYVTLSNCDGLLACYRIRNDGNLRRLVRAPSEFDY